MDPWEESMWFLLLTSKSTGTFMGHIIWDLVKVASLAKVPLLITSDIRH